jgi:UDP-glucuronate decarboxylase
VVSNFIVQALRGEDLTIYGDGAQTRSFCYVDDLVDGILRFAAAEKTGDLDLTGPVNLGNDREFTVRELAEQVLALVGGRSKIVRRPLPSDDPKCRRPDLTVAKTLLNYAPLVPLNEGLRRTIAFFRNQLG